MSGFNAAGVINVAWSICVCVCLPLAEMQVYCVCVCVWAVLSVVFFFCLLKHACVFMHVCLDTYMLMRSILFMFLSRWNKCLLSAKCRSWLKSDCVFICLCVFLGGSVCFAWVSPVMAVPHRAVSAAVLCVCVLADDTVALLWVYCEAFITPAEPVDAERQIN